MDEFVCKTCTLYTPHGHLNISGLREEEKNTVAKKTYYSKLLLLDEGTAKLGQYKRKARESKLQSKEARKVANGRGKRGKERGEGGKAQVEKQRSKWAERERERRTKTSLKGKSPCHYQEKQALYDQFACDIHVPNCWLRRIHFTFKCIVQFPNALSRCTFQFHQYG